jgi:uncharacterized protein
MFLIFKRLEILCLIIGVLLVATSCNDAKRAARAALQEKGWAFTRSTFIESCAKGDESIVGLFLKGGMDVNTQDSDGLSPLMTASIQGNGRLVQFLIEHGANVNLCTPKKSTALLFATAFGHREVVIILIQHGADVNAKDKEKWTPLKLANNKGFSSVAGILKAAGGKQ